MILIAITLAESGGATSFVFRFAQWLVAHGEKVMIVAGDGEWLFKQCRQTNISAIRLKHMGRKIRLLRDMRAFFECWKLFCKLRPEAIHLNSTKIGIIGAAAARFAHIPRVVYRIGGWVFLEPLSPLRRWIYVMLERVSARWKDVIVCVHPNDQIVAEQIGIKPRKKIVMVPNGIDLAAFNAELQDRTGVRRRYGFDDRHFVFATIANFYSVKNLPAYIDACAIVSKKFPDARFLIFGEGAERPLIEKKIKKYNLAVVVLLTGNDDKAWTKLTGADAFVLPSLKEGMSWSLLEAMAAGLPIIATDVGANQWMLVNDAGWIVPSGDTNALADVMSFVIEHPEETKRRGLQAHRKAMERFPIEKTFDGNAASLLV